MVNPRRWLTKRRLLIAAAALLVLPVGWWFSAYPRGMLAAYCDHARGHYEVKTYGYPAEWAREGDYQRLVFDRYGVEVHEVAGCVVNDELVSYVDGYNSVSVSRSNARFGKDIFAECAADAKAEWELRNSFAPPERGQR